MKTRKLAIGAAAAAGLLLAAGGLWANVTTAAQASTSLQDETEVHKGTIKALDIKENKFTLEVPDGAMRDFTVIINPRTAYTLNGQESDRDKALQVGADATVTCRAKSPVAMRVDVTTE